MKPRLGGRSTLKNIVKMISLTGTAVLGEEILNTPTFNLGPHILNITFTKYSSGPMLFIRILLTYTFLH